MTLTTQALADRIGASLRGDAARELHGCAALDEAGPGDVSFLANRKYAPQLATTRAGAVVLSPADADQLDAGFAPAVLVADDPYFAFRNAVVELVGFRKHPAPGVSAQAAVHETAVVGEDCHVGPFVTIAERARLGARCVIYPGCYVGPEAVLGDDCILYPNVTVYDRCTLGDRVTLHAGCSIGQDGFGYATHALPDSKPVHHKIPQIGHTVIEDDVEMGACCTVDRATVGSTVVGAGTKFSNNVTIGHGCKVGRHNLFVGQVGLAGSTRTGDYVVFGGQSGSAGHLHLGDGVQLAARAVAFQDLPGGKQYGGMPAVPLAQARRQWIALQRLPDLLTNIRQLEKRCAQLEARLHEAQ